MNKLIFILAEGFKNVWRHKSSAVSSVFSIYLTLIVSGSLLIVSQNTNKLIEYLRDKYKIEVFFKMSKKTGLDFLNAFCVLWAIGIHPN